MYNVVISPGGYLSGNSVVVPGTKGTTNDDTPGPYQIILKVEHAEQAEHKTALHHREKSKLEFYWDGDVQKQRWVDYTQKGGRGDDDIDRLVAACFGD